MLLSFAMFSLEQGMTTQPIILSNTDKDFETIVSSLKLKDLGIHWKGKEPIV